MKVLLVVLAVAGVSAICVYTMALTGSQVETEDSSRTARAVPVDTGQPADEAQLLDTGTGGQPPAETPPPGKAGEEKPPAEMPPPKEKSGKPASDDFDPLLGEQFDEGAIRGGAPHIDDFDAKGPMAVGGTGEEVNKNQDILRIEKQGQKMQNGLNRKLNTIANRLKLDARAREDLLAISRDGLNEVIEIRKQFAGRTMTDADRAYLKDQVKAANANTTENIRRLLGDDGFKQFKQEGRYYDNPNARVLDKMKDLEKQNREMQKKLNQNKRKTNRKPRTLKAR